MKSIVICGPTASGKTDLALELARQAGGGIISADSRQVYKQLTIGTAKPQGTYHNGLYTVEGVPYWLVDFLEVTDTFNAGAFCTRVHQIQAAYPHIPLIFAGGTGLYLHSFFVGMDNLPPSTAQSRAQMQALLAKHGKEGLHRLLAQQDPACAAQIPPSNIQRTMRALELCLLTSRPASQLKSGRFFAQPDPHQAHWVYLMWDKEALNKRITKRTEQMFDGMCTEAKNLLAQGYTVTTPALKTLGYPQVISYLSGTCSRSQALEQIITKTRQYAKRQRTWFNRYTHAQRITLKCSEDFDTKKLTQEILSCVSR